MATTTRSWWGWGTVEEAVRGSELDALLRRVRELLPDADLTPTTAPAISDLGLPTPRVAAPRALAPLCSHDPSDRAAHTHGKAFRDVVRNLVTTTMRGGGLGVRRGCGCGAASGLRVAMHKPTRFVVFDSLETFRHNVPAHVTQPAQHQ